MPRLRRADCAGAGIRRIKHGRGFRYEDEAGDRLTDEAALERIRRLAIPPAWREVWICPDPQGHIQATGHRRRGSQAVPLPRRVASATGPPKVRADAGAGRPASVAAPQRQAPAGSKGFTRDRVLAGAVRMLDLGFFRIGSEEYAAENESYGLATLRKSHVRSENGAVVFDYPAKSSQRRVQEIADPQLVKLVRALKAAEAAATSCSPTATESAGSTSAPRRSTRT